MECAVPINIVFEKYRLSNGLEVILHEDHSIPVVAVNVWYHVGSQNEEPDRTGFAHLFEHIMFKGSKHHNREYFLPLQRVGANVNGSTTTDRTNYYENVPAEFLELALWLESDRMGYLLDALDQARFEVEREVVKNERRQSYENRPYGLAGMEIRKALFPPNHPYHWEVIGSQEHLDAASLEDVKAFCRRYYAPNNASLVVAGDINVEEARRLVARYFGDLPPGPPQARLERWLPRLDGEVRLRLQDRVQLHRLYFAWIGPPRFAPDDAPADVLMAILGQGRSSRLYRSLVHQRQLAREVSAYSAAMEIAGELRLDATLAPGSTVEEAERAMLAQIERLQAEPPREEEVQRAVNRMEARLVRQLERLGGFGGRADLLNYYNVFAGDPGRVNHDLERYLAVTPADVQRVAREYLGPGRVRLLVTPEPRLAPGATLIDRSQQPGPGQPRAFRPPLPRRLRLATGLELLVVERRAVPAIAAAVHFPGGALTDPPDRPGLASFTARLFTEGTRTRSSFQIADESEYLAARLNVDLRRESCVATTEVLTRHWPRALDLLADILANPVFPEAEVERIRRERLTDLRRLRDDPHAIAERVSNALLFGRDTPYGHPIGGREPSIAAATREELIGLHERVFLRGRPTVILAGDIAAEAAARDIESAFDGWRVEQPPRLAVEVEAEPRPTTLYLVDKPGAAQSVITVGQLTVSRLHPDYLPLVVMNMAFGGQFIARLNMNLREAKGYTYGYHSRLEWRLTRSKFSAGGAVHTAVTREALLETLKEFRDLHGQRPISREEFETAQLALIRGFPPTFETASQVAGRLTELVHFGLPDDYYSDHVQRLQQVSLEEVHRVAAEHVDPERLVVLIVGDLAVIEPPLRELGLPIVHLDYEGQPV